MHLEQSSSLRYLWWQLIILIGDKVFSALVTLPGIFAYNKDINHNNVKLIILGPQTYILSLDWTNIFGPNWQFFDSTAEKQQKMC